MKRLIGSMMVLVAAVSLASVSFASDHGDKRALSNMSITEERCVVNVIGPVVSIDKANSRITVRDQSDKQNKVINVERDQISKLEVGEVVRFSLSASPMAQEVEVIKLESPRK